jgi:hypothetical protein
MRQKDMQYLKSYQKKNSASSPPIFFFFFNAEKKKTEKQQKHAYGEKTNYLVLACRVRANLA